MKKGAVLLTRVTNSQQVLQNISQLRNAVLPTSDDHLHHPDAIAIVQNRNANPNPSPTPNPKPNPSHNLSPNPNHNPNANLDPNLNPNAQSFCHVNMQEVKTSPSGRASCLCKAHVNTPFFKSDLLKVRVRTDSSLKKPRPKRRQPFLRAESDHPFILPHINTERFKKSVFNDTDF